MRVKTRLPVLLAALLSLMLLSGTAMAHKVNIFAYVEATTVFTESYFPDGRPVANGSIEVLDSNNKTLLTGKSDAKGLFSFPLPKKEDLTIVIKASMGHQNTFLLKESDLSGPAVATEVDRHPAPSVEASADEADNCTAVVALLAARDKDLSRELHQIKRDIAALKQEMEEPGLKEVMAGIGYILGLFGVASFMASRKNRQRHGD